MAPRRREHGAFAARIDVAKTRALTPDEIAILTAREVSAELRALASALSESNAIETVRRAEAAIDIALRAKSRSSAARQALTNMYFLAHYTRNAALRLLGRDPLKSRYPRGAQ